MPLPHTAGSAMCRKDDLVCRKSVPGRGSHLRDRPVERDVALVAARPPEEEVFGVLSGDPQKYEQLSLEQRPGS